MDEQNRKSNKFFYFVIFVLIAMIVFVLYFNNNHSSVYVSGSSMFPTLESGDVLFMSNVEVDENGDLLTENGDIIVIDKEKYDRNGESQLLIKRQIAKGQKDKIVVVEIIDGNVYVDGEMLKEEYLGSEGITDCKDGKNRWELYENEIFYLGDNRKDSMDSRFDEYGLCSTDQVVGVVTQKAILYKGISKSIYDLSSFFKGIFNN